MASFLKKTSPNIFHFLVRKCSTKSTLLQKHYQPRRACLYVPGNDKKKIDKASTLEGDCVILDCEDGVAINRKDDARHTIKEVLSKVNFGQTEVSVRVNSLSSGMVESDLKVIFSSDRLPPTVMLPKVERKGDLYQFSELLSNALPAKEEKRHFNLIIFIETATGMLNLTDICKEARLLEEHGSPLSLQGLVFGSDDFCADIGATRTADGKELMYARQKLVLIAKAYRLQAIDMVHIDFKDLDGLRQYSTEGALMGFTGKQCIHPAQVPIVQEAFSPSEEKINWASELIQAFQEHQSTGKGAFTFRGHMIDMPLLLQAKNIIQMSEIIRQKHS